MQVKNKFKPKMMKKIVNGHFLYLILLSILSFGYFFDTYNANVSDTVSDQWNFIPVAIKLDHPELYKGDLFLDNAEDVRYYTPFFISGIRFFSYLTNDNYFEALNLFNLFINLIFSFAWYLFFYRLLGKAPFAFLFSLIIRGLMWLPGYEIWGAGALWTALPRTAFIALIPLAFVLLLFKTRYKYAKPTAYFLLGLFSNFHPISGFGVLLSVFLADISLLIIQRKFDLRQFRSFFICGIMALTGIAPYIYVYFRYVIATDVTDPLLFNATLPMRIGDMFTEPMMVLSKFRELKWILFLLTPYLLILFIYKRLKSNDKVIVNFFMLFTLFILAFSILIIPAELLLRKMGFDIHMAFQLVRNIKYMVIPVFVFYAIFLFNILKLHNNNRKTYYIQMILILGFVFLMLFSRFEPIRSIPLVGDDFIRTTMPNVYSIKKEITPKDTALLDAMQWINTNIKERVKFIGPTELRAQCRQSVIYDGKGASMLIEGNPDKFVKWGKMKIELNNIKDGSHKLELYRQWGAQYVLTKDVFDEEIIYNNSVYYI
jgi:hypothetical protein